MNVGKFVYWAPRILSILFILFLSLLSLDVQGSGFWGTLLAFFMHNIPSLVLLAVLIISWKREIVGAVVFILAGILYAALVLLQPFEWVHLAWIAQISGTAFLVGVLFLICWLRK